MKVIDDYDGLKTKPLPIFLEREINRFWDSIDVRENNVCWEWRRIKNADGYGVFRTTGGSRKKKHSFIASRVSYYLHYALDPSDKRVLHTCDNPICCNPFHLFLGTHQENIEDMMKKGRKANRVGEKNTMVKLNELSVKEIRDKFEKGQNRLDLAKEYNVSKDTISAVVKRINWKHI